jgi:WD40 repeat protein
VGSSDKTVTIFDVPSSRKLETFRFGSKVTSLMWSSNDAVVVVGLHEPSNKAVIIEIGRPPADDQASTYYEFNPEELVAPFLHQVDSSDAVRTVAWSKNDEYLALGTNGKEARIVKCDIENNSFSEFSESHETIQCGGPVMAVAWTGKPVTSTRAPLADRKYDKTVARLAVGSYDKSVRIVEVSSSGSTLKLKERTITFSGAVFAVAWSSNDLYLAVGSMGGSASVIDVISCQTMYEIKRDVGVMTGEHVSRGKYLN